MLYPLSYRGLASSWCFGRGDGPGRWFSLADRLLVAELADQTVENGQTCGWPVDAVVPPSTGRIAPVM